VVSAVAIIFVYLNPIIEIRTPRRISGSRSKTLDSYRSGKKYCFIDLNTKAKEAGNSWMFQTITAKSWGRSDFTMIPREQYNGILHIDTVSPPNFGISETVF